MNLFIYLLAGLGSLFAFVKIIQGIIAIIEFVKDTNANIRYLKSEMEDARSRYWELRKDTQEKKRGV